MNTAYLDFIAAAGAAEITHIGLVDDTGTELTGGSPAYARKAVTWTASVAGLIRPNADHEFDVPAGASVAEWRGYNALTAGDDYEGEDVDLEDFTNQGTYTLLAASTGIQHSVPA
jgi:hypothetical protein